MEIIGNIIQTTLSSFDFAFCISVNILTYLIIKIIDRKFGVLKTWGKRIILLSVIALMSVGYYLFGADGKLIINSAILAPVFWTWIMKPICQALKIDYKQLTNFD